MRIEKESIERHNEQHLAKHRRHFDFLSQEIGSLHTILDKLVRFQVAVPSWALGTGGTRFGRFSGKGEPGTLEQKIEDVGLRSEERRVGKEGRSWGAGER